MRGTPRAEHEPDVEQADEGDLDEGTASDLAGKLEIRDNPVSRSYGAVLDGTVVATIVYEDDGTRRACHHTVVDPDHRGRGIVTMVVNAALDDDLGRVDRLEAAYAARSGVVQAKAHVRSDNALRR